MITLTDSRGRKTTFLRQRLANTTSGPMTHVTGHVLITEGIWHGSSDGYGLTFPDAVFAIEHRNPPAGLPLVDESSPVGAPILPAT